MAELKRLWTAFGVGLALACAAAGLFCAPAHAAAVSYSMIFCEDLGVLKNPTNQALLDMAGMKTQLALMTERTMPYMELKNTSADADITQFSLTIGDASKNFDWAKMIETSPGITFSLINLDTVQGGLKSDTLVFKFTNFKPGEFVRFRADISPDNSALTAIQDYRMTFFKLNGTDTSQNSNVTVDFQNSDGTESLLKQLINFKVSKPTSTSMAFPFFACADTVTPFFFGDSGTILPPQEGPPVPEPGSVVLLGIGAAALVGWRVRRLRRTGGLSLALARKRG